MTPNLSRRSMLVGTGAAVAGVLGVGSTVSADGHDIPVVIETVSPEEDLIVLRNEGDSEIDLSGYIIDWLYNNPDYDQSDSLPAGTHIPAGGQLRITSGYYDTEADVVYDYGAGRINNDYTNVLALYTPSRTNAVSVFDTSTMEAAAGDPVDGGGPDGESDEEGEDEPADSDGDEDSEGGEEVEPPAEPEDDPEGEDDEPAAEDEPDDSEDEDEGVSEEDGESVAEEPDESGEEDDESGADDDPEDEDEGVPEEDDESVADEPDESGEEDGESGADDDPDDHSEDEGEAEPVATPPTELSVSVPESISVTDSARFDVTVWNHGTESAEVTVTLEVGNVSDASTVEIAGDDCDRSVHTVAGSDLCVGENDWTVTAGEESERGTLTVSTE